MTRLRLTFLLTATYFAVIALAVIIAARSPVAMTELSAVLFALLPYQTVAVLIAFAAVSMLGGWAANGFGPIRWQGLLWMTPSWVILAFMFENIAREIGGAKWPLPQGVPLLLLLSVPLLIAIGEEVMFRGVLLRQALARMSVTRAMLLSAVLFALLHLVNGLLGQGFSNTVQQVAFAFLVGFSLAPIALRAENLWPLIIWHWLWNVAVFTSQAADVLQPLVLSGMAIQVAVSGWLWRDLATQHRV